MMRFVGRHWDETKFEGLGVDLDWTDHHSTLGGGVLVHTAIVG